MPTSYKRTYVATAAAATTVVLALIAVLIACTAARSIEELYQVEVGPDDTAQAALQPETRRRPSKPSKESHGKESEESSNEGSSDEDMAPELIAVISIAVVLACAGFVAVFSCCLFGWCCFAKESAVDGRRHSTVVVRSSIVTVNGTVEKTAEATSARNSTPAALTPSPYADDRPPEYADVVFVPIAPADDPALVHISQTHVIVGGRSKLEQKPQA